MSIIKNVIDKDKMKSAGAHGMLLIFENSDELLNKRNWDKRQLYCHF